MLAMQSFFVALFLLVCFGETLIKGESTNVRTKHLFVQKKGPRRGSSSPLREIYLPENGYGSAEPSEEDSTFRRSRRSTRQRRSTNNDPTRSLHQFNDNHNMLYVHWTGAVQSKTVVVLSRDSRPTSKSTSYLYVSNNYGVHYHNQSHKLNFTKKGITKRGLIERFYANPNRKDWYVFADTTNNVIFTSKTDCESFTSHLLNFKPSDITFHGSKHNGLLAWDDETHTIYYSNDFGANWSERENNVTSYYWGIEKLDSDNTVYLEIDNGNGTSNVIRGHWNHKHFYTHTVLQNVIDFEINDEYMFATKKSKNGLDLFVLYHYHDMKKAEFPNKLKRQSYFIADASEGQVFVAVNHNKNTSHLYISDTRGEYYTLSMERILFYSPDRTEDIWLRRYRQEEFVDIHAVAAIRGIYVASQLNNKRIVSMITFNKGRSWRKVSSPIRHANGSLVQCVISGTCSLHLALLYARVHPWYFAPSIKSKESAPGLIVSSGNIGKTLNRHSNVYVSNDAGDSWLEVLQGRWYFNFVDHGGVIVAVRQWSPTKELRYSTDEGLTWKTYQFTNTSVRVYGVLTEPGEMTTIFTIFGSYSDFHSWLVVQVDTKNVLGKSCTKADYETWTPRYRKYGYGCILGQRLDYERRKRNSTCLNGQNYDRPVNTTICHCSDQDYECDAGFIPWWHLCRLDPNAGFDPHAPPRPCRRGTTYNDTQGYRKIAGDKCSPGVFSWWFEPREVSCPFELDTAFLLYAERTTIQYVDLTNNSRSTQIKGLRGAVAVAYNMKDQYIYWADIKDYIIYGRGIEDDVVKAIAGVKQVEGLDFDWISENLYWVDSVKKVIEVCKKDGLFRKTVHVDDLDRPRALALDPPYGEMFWTDWGKNPKIEMSDMDGKNRKVLVNSGIYWPNGLAIDMYKPKSSRILYYTDAKKDIIGSYDLHTKTTKILASKTDHKDQWGSILQHPYSIAVDDQYVYWDDWQSGKVFRIHKSFKGKVDTLVDRDRDLPAKSRYEIKVYYKKSQSETGSCSTNKCTQLCLPKPNKKKVCACADDQMLDVKTKKCKCIGGLTTLKNGTCKRASGKDCASHEFPCDNGYCVPLESRCDWFNDCGDYSDEYNCSSIKRCNGTEFPCPDGSCIPQYYLCNGRTDCESGEDESPRVCTRCPKDEFRCDNAVCLPKNKRCDGNRDCEDTSDEKNCDTLCINKLKCHDGKGCYNATMLCNNVKDCSDGSDELCSSGGNNDGDSGAQKSSTKKTLTWAVPVGVVFVILLVALGFFMVKSRRLHRSFYHLVRSDSFDHGVTYHNGDDDDTPLIQGFSDDDPLVEA